MTLSLSIIFIVLLSYSSYVNCQTGITPLYSCWFYTYREQLRIINVVLGYNSTEVVNVTLPQDTTTNFVLSSHVEGGANERPTLFLPGLHRFVYTVRINETVAVGATFLWGLFDMEATQKTVEVAFPEDFTDALQCNTRFNQQCTPEASVFPNFCEDSLYCNGRERCEGGICLPGIPIVCGAPPPPCNESTRCLPANTTQSPTSTPTIITTNTPTGSPTSVITSKPPTVAPTAAQTTPPPSGSPTIINTTTEPPTVEIVEPAILYGNLTVILIIIVFCVSVVFIASKKRRRWC